MLKRFLLCATTVSVCLLSTQSFAVSGSSSDVQKLEKQVAELQKQVKALAVKEKAASSGSSKNPPTPKQMSVLGHMVESGVTISTTPFLGLRDGQILYNLPSMNEDLRILKQRKYLEAELNKLGASLNDRTLIGISGALEGAFIEQNNWRTKWAGNTDLNTAEIDIGVMAGSWIDGFFSITYNAISMDTGSRVPNNQLYLQRGFLTIGNLAKSPFYFTIGQMYVPFGRYASAMITTPLTQSMGRISARAGVLGFAKGPWFAELYGYNSDSRNETNFPADEGGVNMGAEFDNGVHSFQFGVGAVSNMGDSQGALVNGATTGYLGFDGAGSNFVLRKNVAGVDAFANYSIGNWNFIAEYLTAVRDYNPADMYFDSPTRGARPAALHTEIDYNNYFFGKPATAAITFGETWEGLAMNLPRYSVVALYDVQVWKHSAIGVEVRHDINYKTGTPYGGATSSTTTSTQTSVGGSRDIITARFGVYF